MAFTATTKLLIDFDEVTPTESVSGNALSVQGTDQAVVLLDNGLGYSMNPNQHLRAESVSLSVTNAMTIGFWLKPHNHGYAEDTSNGSVKEMRVSLLDVVGTYLAPIVLVYETSTKDAKNKLTVEFGTSGFSFMTPAYTVDAWHHFWITYDGSGSAVSILVDGEVVSGTTTGAIPTSLNGATGTVHVNRLALDADFDTALNQGDIDDIVILNSVDSSDATVQKVINYSLDFAFDTSFMDSEEVDQALVFDDPDVFRVTSVEDDGTSVFVTRSDGKILEGTPTMWQVRRKFRNENEVDSLAIFGDGFEQKDGFLEISGNAIVSV